jgi:hypothetical protein
LADQGNKIGVMSYTVCLYNGSAGEHDVAKATRLFRQLGDEGVAAILTNIVACVDVYKR